MRVALVQIELDATSGAGNTQRIGRAIDRAAGVSPAPDLLVLPAACDTGGVVRPKVADDARLSAVREAIALKAKEWGVYIAAGVHWCTSDGNKPCTVLYDPDADIVAQAGIEPDEALDIVSAEPLRRTPIGWMGVSPPAGFDAIPDGLSATDTGIVIAWPVNMTRRRATQSTAIGERTAAYARSTGGYWAVVMAATAKAGTTHVCGPDGQPVVATNGDGETVTYADLDVHLAPDAPEGDENAA